MITVKITRSGSASAILAQFYRPEGLVADRAGNLYVADTFNHCIRKIAPSGEVTTLAGSTHSISGHTDAVGTDARFNNPQDLVIASSGDLFVTDGSNHCIRQVTPDGTVTTFAGTTGTTSGHTDDTGTAARFAGPWGIAIDSSDNLYVTETSNHCVRKITPEAVVTTFAGTTGTTSGHTDAKGTSARFNDPRGIVLSSVKGVLYLVEADNHCIRSVGISGGATGVVTTFAGTTGTTSGHTDATGTSARFNSPTGITCDDSGTLYVADNENHCIRKVTTLAVVSTLVGTTGTTSGFVDGTGTAARFYRPYDVEYDSVSGCLFVADTYNNRIRKVTAAAQVMTSAGSGVVGHLDATVSSQALTLRENITEDTPIGPVKLTAVQFGGANPGGHGTASFDLIVRDALRSPPKAVVPGAWVEIDDGTPLWEGQILSLRRSIDADTEKFSVSCGGLLAVARQREDLTVGWVYPISDRWQRLPGTPELGSITVDNSVLDIRAPVGTTEGINAAGMSTRLAACFLLDDLLSDQEISWVDWTGTYDVATGVGGQTYTLCFDTSPDGTTWTIYSAATKTASTGTTAAAFAPPAGTKALRVAIYSNTAAHTIAADKFANFTKFDIYASGRIAKPRLDEAMAEIATRPGLADTAVTRRVGGLQDDCSVGWANMKTTVADGLPKLAAKHATPPRWGFWDDRTFEVRPEPPTPDNDAHVVLVESGLVSLDDGEETEDVYDYANVLYTDSTTGRVTQLYRPTTPPDDAQKVKLLDHSTERHTAAAAQSIGDFEIGRRSLGIPLDYGLHLHMARACLGQRPGDNDDLLHRDALTELSNNRAIGSILGLATGGTITLDGAYVVHKFTSSGSLVFPTGSSVALEYLLVGGGGGGSAGGGGAGGYLAGNTTGSGTMAIVVGAGGAGASPASANGTTGSDSTFAGLTAKGGGGGGKDHTAGSNGGAGGGGGYDGTITPAGGTGTAGQGTDGGTNGGYKASPYAAGGGGGSSAGAATANAPDSSHGGPGGAGTNNDITGTTVGYAGGGGGGTYGAGTGGAATHGGGAGGTSAANGTNGTANTGGGGGGAGNGKTGGIGGAGVVIVRYLLADLIKADTWSETNGYSGSNSPADPSCFVFDGSHSISFGDLAQLDRATGAFSIGVWFSFTAIGAAQVLFAKRAPSGTALPGIEARIETDGKLKAVASQDTGAGTYRAGKGATVLGTNTFYHALFVYAGSGGDWTIYLNGVAETMTAAGTAGAIDTDNTAPACIGSRGGIATLLTGSVGVTTFWPRALTAAEAVQITDAGPCLYARSTTSGTLTMQGICRDRRRSPIPARRIRSGWWLQYPDGAVVPITGHSVAPSTDTNALTVGVDWWASELGARQAEFMAIPLHEETLADTEAEREAEYNAQVAAEAAEAAAAAAAEALANMKQTDTGPTHTKSGKTKTKKGKIYKPRKKKE